MHPHLGKRVRTSLQLGNPYKETISENLKEVDICDAIFFQQKLDKEEEEEEIYFSHTNKKENTHTHTHKKQKKLSVTNSN